MVSSVCKKDANADISKREEELASTGGALLAVTNEITSTAGPFTRAVNDTLLRFNIRERKYHGGEYVGNDCDRIMQYGAAISDGLRRRQLIDVNGATAYGGDDGIAQKYASLLSKLYDCSKLFSAARPLCLHEIERLERYSSELAALWPRTFTPKFHLLTFHMPHFARDWGSIGLASEQCVEASHRMFNSLGVTFAGLTNPILRLKSMGRRFLLRADPSIPKYTPPKRVRHSTVPRAIS